MPKDESRRQKLRDTLSFKTKEEKRRQDLSIPGSSNASIVSTQLFSFLPEPGLVHVSVISWVVNEASKPRTCNLNSLVHRIQR